MTNGCCHIPRHGNHEYLAFDQRIALATQLDVVAWIFRQVLATSDVLDVTSGISEIGSGRREEILQQDRKQDQILALLLAHQEFRSARWSNFIEANKVTVEIVITIGLAYASPTPFQLISG